jgi:hypothetical protein
MPVKKVRLKNWKQITKYQKQFWFFRGQRDARWGLASLFDRLCNREGFRGRDRNLFETESLREFKRSYHHYSIEVPADTANLEWLSIMQHHGCPTRLLDFTYSLYNALYFAIEAAEGASPAVWAMNGSWVVQTGKQMLLDQGVSRADANKLCNPLFGEGREGVIEELFFGNSPRKFVFPLNPFKLNQRLRTQSGIFLVPGDPRFTFEENLTAMKGHDSPANLVKIVLPLKKRREALRALFNMNCSRTTLFPGLDGFAQTMGVFAPWYDKRPRFDDAEY